MRTSVLALATLCQLTVSPYLVSCSTPPGIQLDMTVLTGQLSDATPATGNRTIYGPDGTQIRLQATASGGWFRPVSTVEFTISQGGQVQKAFGPPGTATKKKGMRRSVPVCDSSLIPPIDCNMQPMALLRASQAPVVVKAKATGPGGTSEIVVTFVAYNNSGVSTTPPTPPANPTPCTQTIALLPSYVFDNRSKKLTSASFYFSATYIGPAVEDGNLVCAPGSPPGVSVFLGPFAPLTPHLDTRLPTAGQAKYAGQIVRRGWWSLTAYSPEVGVFITCKRRFANNGIVQMSESDPTSINGCL